MKLKVGKTYNTESGLKVEIHGTNSLGEFTGCVHTEKKKNWGRKVKEPCLWKEDGTCCWPSFPEWKLVEEIE